MDRKDFKRISIINGIVRNHISSWSRGPNDTHLYDMTSEISTDYNEHYMFDEETNTAYQLISLTPLTIKEIDEMPLMPSKMWLYYKKKTGWEFDNVDYTEDESSYYYYDWIYDDEGFYYGYDEHGNIIH